MYQNTGKVSSHSLIGFTPESLADEQIEPGLLILPKLYHQKSDLLPQAIRLYHLWANRINCKGAAYLPTRSANGMGEGHSRQATDLIGSFYSPDQWVTSWGFTPTKLSKRVTAFQHIGIYI
jgi:hypothetical protein